MKQSSKPHGSRKDLPDSIIAEYRAGATMAQIAARYKVAPATVFNRLREFGEPTRRRGHHGGQYPCTIERRKKMIAMLRAGFTMQQIGTEHGVTRQRVSQILQEAGK